MRIGNLSEFVDSIQRGYFDAVPKLGQPLSSIRILITDDSADWPRQVRLLLQARPE